MPVTFEEVQQHKKFHGFDDLETTTVKKYRRLLSSDALFVVDHHDFLRSSLTRKFSQPTVSRWKR